MKGYRSYLPALLCLVCSANALAQGLVNNGAQIVVRQNTSVMITQNFVNKNDGAVENDGIIDVNEDWTNDAQNPVFKTNSGEVILSGNNQSIQGTTTTGFNDLTLSGNGVKSMEVDVLVGGAHNKGGSGTLDLGTRTMVMNSNTLIVNNSSPLGITTSGGNLLGETDPNQGYSTVQWNVRNQTARILTVPFANQSGIPIPFSFELVKAGNQASDSGFVSIATYPTDPTLNPNNRPLPNGVNNLNNIYGVENDILVLDRFWIVGTDGYVSKPLLEFDAVYEESAWDQGNGSRNTIQEEELRWVKYVGGTDAWSYPGDGDVNTNTNNAKSSLSDNYNGIWMLSAIPFCPIADFAFEEECEYDPIRFNNTSTLSLGTIDTVVWNAESNSYSGNTADHLFSSFGNFDVRLKVRSDLGCWDSISKTVTVYPKPSASFEYQDTCLNDIAIFTDRSSTPNGIISPQDLLWIYEDGTRNVGKQVSRSFSTDGPTKVELQITNSWGCLDTVTQFPEIQPPPTAAFRVDSICEESIAYFEDLSTTKGSLVSWKWDLDLATSSQQYPSQQYMIKGYYPIQLIVENEFGCFDTTGGEVYVRAKSRAAFSYNPKQIYRSEPLVRFTDESISATEWTWNFGDGAGEYGAPIVRHSFSDTGYFDVSLIVNSEANCPDTAVRSVYIAPDVKVYIPNTFTPQGEDDLNSVFRPVGEFSGLEEFSMEIYNRWGEKIFESQNLSEAWDGTYMGTPVQQDSYLYIIRTLDIYKNEVWYHGVVTVLR